MASQPMGNKQRKEKIMTLLMILIQLFMFFFKWIGVLVAEKTNASLVQVCVISYSIFKGFF